MSKQELFKIEELLYEIKIDNLKFHTVIAKSMVWITLILMAIFILILLK
ncbi:hypothetical protein AB8888_02785 [Yersinia enterocolitica]|nr:hypothetical protein [Yersinia enterocolitica]